eukprot:TRINITY_DN4832_c0_g3_i3.p2 TRINITY_DN4832_c0_g3~~TRINITY_DN4832_c0_g3_i3.p2  ORF type:complete len:133 (-),score=6.51 TRINITY_DN4832_c0_g3_i3:391-789(-)
MSTSQIKTSSIRSLQSLSGDPRFTSEKKSRSGKKIPRLYYGARFYNYYTSDNKLSFYARVASITSAVRRQFSDLMCIGFYVVIDLLDKMPLQQGKRYSKLVLTRAPSLRLLASHWVTAEHAGKRKLHRLLPT